MKKLVFTIIAIVILASVFFVYKNSDGENQELSVQQPTSFPGEQSVTPFTDQSDGIRLKTTSGSISVRDFLNDSRTSADPVNQGHFQLGYYIDPQVETESSPPYYIEYVADAQYFTIALLQDPIKDSRTQAEQFLLEYLGINQEQLCSLNYMVSAPVRVSSLLAGQSLGFSFCPGSISLN